MKFLLCDIGGVLLKLSFDRALAYWKSCGGLDTWISREKIFDPEFCRFETGGISSNDYVLHLGKKLGPAISRTDIIDGWNAIFMSIDTEVEGIIKEVRLRGVRAIGVTNTNAIHKEYWSRKYPGIVSTFDTFYSSMEVGHRKPDWEIFEYILGNQGLRKQDGVFVDDVLENVAGAESFGLPSILFSDAAQLRIALSSRGFL